MLIEKEQFDKKKFMQEFNKKFWNFSEKSPLFLKYSVIENDILIYDFSKNPENKPIKFSLDYSIDVKSNIKIIKDYLVENNYPVFKVRHISYKSYDVTETMRLMQNEKVSLKDLANKQKEVINEELYRLEKVFNQDNRIAVRNLKTNEIGLYQLKIPVTFFMNELFNGTGAPNIFTSKAELIKNIVDVNQA